MTPEEQQLLQERARSEQQAEMQKFLQAKQESEVTEQEQKLAEAEQTLKDLGPKRASRYAARREEKELSPLSQALENTQETFALKEGQMEVQEKWMEENVYIPLLDLLQPNKDAEQVAKERAEARRQQTFQGRDLEKEFSDKVLDVEASGSLLERGFWGTASNINAFKTGAQQGIFLGIPALAEAAIDLAQGRQTRKTYFEMPEYAKSSPFARLFYDAGRTIYSPWSRLTGGKTKLGQFVRKYVAEAAVETATQQDVDDYFLSRTFAEQYGRIINAQGGDGEEATRRLLEGEGLGYNAANTGARFIYNLSQAGIADKALGFLGNLAKPSRQAAKVASDTGEDAAKIAKQENTRVQSKVDTDVDPIDSTSPDYNVVDVDVKNGVSVRGAQLAARANLNDADNANLDSPFFLHTRVFTDDDPLYESAIDYITKDYQRIFPNQEVRADYMYKSMDFLRKYKDVFDTPTKEMVEDFFSRFSERANIEEFSKGNAKAVEMWMVQNAMFDPAGASAAGFVMRELNQRLVREAGSFTTLFDAEGGDLKAVLTNIKNIVRSGETWANVNRVRQQQWNIGGDIVQRTTQKEIRDMLERGVTTERVARRASRKLGRKVSREEILAVQASTGGGEASFTKLIDEAIEGNLESLDKVRSLLAYIATQDPEKSIDFGTLSSSKMRDLFFDGTTQQLTTGYYTLNLLGRIRTGMVGIAGGITKVLENSPLILPAKALVKMQTDPKNMLKIRDYADFMSMQQGHYESFKETWKVGKQGFIKNKPLLEANTLIGKKTKNLEELNTELTGRYTQYIKTLDEEGVDELDPRRIEAWFNYNLRKNIINNPALTPSARLLTAGDEAFKANGAFAVARMLANRRIAMEGLDPKTAPQVYDEVIKRIFKDGDPLKGFRQTEEAKEAAAYARNVTFQREIPNNTGSRFSLSNQFAQTMSTIDAGVQRNFAFRWAAPFPRMTWDFINTSSSMIVGAIPGGPTLARTFDPDVRATLRGEKGIVEKQILENNFAAGMTAFYSVAGLTWGGYLAITPVVSKQGEQSLSLVIMDPTNPNDKVEVDLARLGPISVPIGLAASLSQELREGNISQGDYEEGMTKLLQTFGRLVLDQTFLTGLLDVVAILNVRDWNQYTAANIGKLIGSGTGLGLVRAFGEMGEGYRYPTYLDGDMVGNFIRGWASRSGFDIFIEKPDPFTNIYTNKLQKTRVFPDDADWYQRLSSGVLGELSPYNMQPRTVDDRIASKSLQYYETDGKYLTTIGTGDNKIALETLQQQAALSADIANPRIGNLRGRLDALFKSKLWKQTEKRYLKLRSQDNDGLLPRAEIRGVGSEAALKGELRSMIASVHAAAKDAALNEGQLREWYSERKLELVTPVQQSSMYNGRTSGLYATAAQQDTQLANQVREILDLST